MTYREFAPSGFDSKGMGLPDRQDWDVVGLRWSNHERGSFATPRSARTEVHRFNHWLLPWFEVKIRAPKAVRS